jgi:hypothetical protein
MFMQIYGYNATAKDIYKKIAPKLEEIERRLHTIPKNKLQQTKSSVEEHSDEIVIMSVIAGTIEKIHFLDQ